MIAFQFIRGLSVGIEYLDDEDMGFIVNCDLGIIRITWYRDMDEVE